MLAFVNKHFQFLVIVGLVLFLYAEGAFQRAARPEPTVIYQTDTSWKNLLGRGSTQPVLIQTIPYPVDRLSTEYLPDTNYARLKVQFERLRDSLLATNVQRQRLPLDTLGYVEVTDTTHKNRVVGSSYTYQLKYPTITNTITIREPYRPRVSVLAGCGLSATPQLQVREVEVGVFLKDRKDRLYGLGGGYIPSLGRDGAVVKLSHYRTLKWHK